MLVQLEKSVLSHESVSYCTFVSHKQQTDAKAVTIDKPQGRCKHSIAKGIGPLSCTHRCFNGIVLIVEIINQKVIQNYVKGVRRFDS